MGLIDELRKSKINRLAAIDNQNKSFDRDIWYKPGKNKDGVGDVILRFLPQKDLNALPYVLTYSHFFKGTGGKWCIVPLCPTSLKEKCPICEKNSEIWNSGDVELQKKYSSHKRKKEYIANVYVISDKEQPEKEGTVQVFKFGPQIYQMLLDAIKPRFETDESIDPFDVLEGANFNLRVFNDPSLGGQVSYKRSEFKGKSALFDGDEQKIMEVLNQTTDLSTFLSPDRLLSESKMLEIIEYGYGDMYKKPQQQAQHQSISSPVFPQPSENMSMDDTLQQFRQLANGMDDVPF